MFTPVGAIGVPSGTGQKSGCASRAGSPGRIRQPDGQGVPAGDDAGDVLRLAGLVGLRADDVGAKLLAGPSGILGLSARSIENLKVCAVTGAFDGGEKRKPGLIVNV